MQPSLVEEFANLSEASILQGVEALAAQGQKPRDILAMLQMGMEIVSRRYDRGEYAIADLIMASELFVQALGLLGLSPNRPRAGRLGTLLLGGVHDGHELGKNLVGMVLGAGGLRVVDLGVRLGPLDFQKALRHYHPKFVGLSCTSTLGFETLKACVERIRNGDPKGEIRILVGGFACDEASAAWCGADVYCRTPREALLYCRAVRSRWKVL